MNDEAFVAGSHFLLSQARLLEQRLFATCFLGAPASGVVAALRGYQNDDGGFGHGLEPDKRCPASLPLDVETALKAFVAADTLDLNMVLQGATSWPARPPMPEREVPCRWRSPSSKPSRMPST